MIPGQQQARTEHELKLGASDTTEGVCVSVDWAAGLVTVNISGGITVMPMAGDAPWPGDAVRVVFAGQKPVCVGVRAGSPMGTVKLAPVGGLVNVTGDDGVTYVYPYDPISAYSSGSRVRLDHHGRWVSGLYSAEPAGSEFATPTAPASRGGSKWFNPTWSGNFRGSTFSDAGVEISDSRSGFYGYGSQIADTIPNSASITKAVLVLVEEWDNVPATASKLGTHTAGSQPGSPPTLAGSADVSNGGDIDVLAFADALKTGAASGFGFSAAFGWRRFASSASSGQILIEWT